MQLIGRGREASVYLNEDGMVEWVMDGPDAHGTAYIGWRLCKNRLRPPHFPLVHQIYDARRDEPIRIVMEYVLRGTPVKWNEEQAQAILDELKAANVFHRDIRPEHLVIRPTGEWCLLDFGWACDYDDPYPHPWALGGRYRSSGGPDDNYAMEKIKREMGEK
jgi:serine/threonine protein kinase